MNKIRYQKGGHDYAGDTESTSATRKIKKGRKGKKDQKKRVLDISSKQKDEFTGKQKRSTKRIMRKSDRMYRAEERQEKREKRTGSKEGTGLIGKVRKKFIDANKKRRSKGINRNMDKLTGNQAFNVGRRYTPGKTYMYKGKERSEKTRSEVPKGKIGTDHPWWYEGKQKGGVKGDKIDTSLDAAGMVPQTGIKGDWTESKKDKPNKSIDYNKALSVLGLIPAAGKVAKLGKAARKARKAKKGKKFKKQTGGSFNTGRGSFIEPGVEQI
jgi:hypothetical protein